MDKEIFITLNSERLVARQKVADFMFDVAQEIVNKGNARAAWFMAESAVRFGLNFNRVIDFTPQPKSSSEADSSGLK